jgi:hypothetical protein
MRKRALTTLAPLGISNDLQNRQVCPSNVLSAQIHEPTRLVASSLEADPGGTISPEPATPDDAIVIAEIEKQAAATAHAFFHNPLAP